MAVVQHVVYVTLPFNSDANNSMALTKVEVLVRALTTSQYAKLSDFPDIPLPQNIIGNKSAHTSLQPDIRILLARQNRMLKSMAGDGNCFFRAIADAMHGSQEHHSLVRRDIVGYIEQNPGLFSPLVMEQRIALKFGKRKC